ncbi:MAG: thioredoxin family protein [Bacteroidales bacterium]|nr:thioredoxin family protein [Bacteroidales bacterium]
MNVRKIFLSLCMLIIASTTLFAQQMNPAKWKYEVKSISDNEAELQFTVSLENNWHIYSQHTDENGPIGLSFNFDKTNDYTLVGNVAEPKPHEEFDEMFKCTVRSFSGTVVFRQKIKINTSNDFKVTGIMSYQLCNDGSCIAPEDIDFSFNVKGAKATATTAEDKIIELQTNTEVSEETTDTAATVTEETTAVSETISAEKPATKEGKGGSIWFIFLTSFGVGLITLLTPCVFPMIPMTINFFMNSGENRKKGMRQAMVFGLSIVFIFGVLGVLLSLIFGPQVMYLIGTHWIPNLIFFVIFLVFALSFFGLFEITLPSWLINKSDEEAEKGGILAPFFIALTTVLVSFSCTGPILGGALIELSAGSTNRLIPLISMLGFAIGFALPFTLLAMFPSVLRNLKSGNWLNTVKVVFAFLELALGLKFLSMADLNAGWGILDRETYLALWITIFGLMGLYLIGKIHFKGDEPGQPVGVGRLFLAIITFAFVVYMIPGMWGAPLKAISGYVPPMTTQDFDLEKSIYESTKNIKVSATAETSSLPTDRKYSDKLHMPTGFDGFYDLEEAKAYAKKVNKPLFIDFTGKTCANCREMEYYVWTDEEVKKILNEEYVMVALYADVNYIEIPEEEWITDSKGRTIKTLGKRNLEYQKNKYNMNAQPYYVLIDSEENVLTKENHKYDRDVNNFVNFLNEGLENFKKSTK